MPNWVFNYLTVRTEDKGLIIGKEHAVDFETLIPMPEELHNTVSGGDIEDCMAYQYLNTHTKKEFLESKYSAKRYYGITKSMEKSKMLQKLRKRISDNPHMFNNEFFDNGEHKHTPEEVGQYYLDLEAKFGFTNWYEWSIANWGCKWNACYPSIVSEENGITCFQFDTPWGCPEEWLEELAKKIPFHLSWEEEQGYRGIITSLGNGICTDEELPMLEWEENEDGDLIRSEDEYGESWTDLYMDTVFQKGA